MTKLPSELEKPDTTEKCPRCGDMFYHPKTVIEDYRQQAAEWEDEAKRHEATIQALREDNGRLLEELRQLKKESGKDGGDE